MLTRDKNLLQDVIYIILIHNNTDATSILLTTPTMSVGVGRIFQFVRLSVCLFVCSIKTNEPKVFKLGVGNDLEIP